MLRKVLLIIVMLSAAVFASESDFRDGLGFYSPESPTVPAMVRSATESVFELRTLAAGSEEMLMVIDLAADKGEAFKKKISALPTADFDDQDKVVLLSQVEHCQQGDSDLREHCPVTFDVRRASGFLAGNGSTLWTNAHVIDGFLTAIEKYEGMAKADVLKSGRELRTFIFDRKHHLVVTPFKEKVVPTILPEPTDVAKTLRNFYAEDSDYIGLSLEHAIGAPLKISGKRPTVGERIWGIGFPACTGCTPENVTIEEPLDFADRSPGPNSDGIGMKISTGVVLETIVLAPFFGMSEEVMRRWDLDQIIFDTADSNHGDSGGPLVNAAGEVVAIYTGGKSRILDEKYRRISRAVIPPQFLRP